MIKMFIWHQDDIPPDKFNELLLEEFRRQGGILK